MGATKPQAKAAPKRSQAASAIAKPRAPRKNKEAKRKLIRWNDSHEKRLILAIQFCCNEKGILLPWDMIGQYVEGVTAGAIQQHLAKLRQRLQEWGEPVPPPLRRGTQATSGYVSARINNAPEASIKRPWARRPTAHSAAKKDTAARGRYADYFDNTDDELGEPEPKREDEMIGDIPTTTINDSDVEILKDGEPKNANKGSSARRVAKKPTEIKQEQPDHGMDSDSDGLYSPPHEEGEQRKRVKNIAASRPLYNAPAVRTKSTRPAAQKARKMAKAGLESITEEDDDDFTESDEDEESEEEYDNAADGNDEEGGDSEVEYVGQQGNKTDTHYGGKTVNGANEVAVPKKIVGMELGPRYTSPRYPHGLMHWPSGESGVAEIANRGSGDRDQGNFGHNAEKIDEKNDDDASALDYSPPPATRYASETVRGMGNAQVGNNMPYYQVSDCFGDQLHPTSSSSTTHSGSSPFINGLSQILVSGNTISPQSLSRRASNRGPTGNSLFIPLDEHSPKHSPFSKISGKDFKDTDKTFQPAVTTSFQPVDYTSNLTRNEQMRKARELMGEPEESQSHLDLNMDDIFDADFESYQ